MSKTITKKKAPKRLKSSLPVSKAVKRLKTPKPVQPATAAEKPALFPLRAGDYVKVLRIPSARDLKGWDDVWVPQMNSLIGETYKVSSVDWAANSASLVIPNLGVGFNFPISILEKIGAPADVVDAATEEANEAIYIAAVAAADLHDNDLVEVLRQPTADDLRGWDGKWSADMDKAVGSTIRIIATGACGCLKGLAGIMLDDKNRNRYPVTVLRKALAVASGSAPLKPWTEEDYQANATSVGFRRGDFAKVIRSAKDHESGWGNSWTTEMDRAIGGTFEVLGSDDGNGVMLEDGMDNASYPFFVLEKTTGPAVSPTDLYLKGQAAFNARPGERVKVIRSAASYEAGWDQVWASACMDKFVGQTLTVARVDGPEGIELKVDAADERAGFQFPFFVLARP